MLIRYTTWIIYDVTKGAVVHIGNKETNKIHVNPDHIGYILQVGLGNKICKEMKVIITQIVINYQKETKYERSSIGSILASMVRKCSLDSRTTHWEINDKDEIAIKVFKKGLSRQRKRAYGVLVTNRLSRAYNRNISVTEMFESRGNGKEDLER